MITPVSYTHLDVYKRQDLSYVEIGKNEGAKLVCGGHRLDQGEYQNGWFMEPTVFIDVDNKMRIAQEEIFGPVVSIIPCDDLEDAIEIANGIESVSYTHLDVYKRQGCHNHQYDTAVCDGRPGNVDPRFAVW